MLRLPNAPTYRKLPVNGTRLMVTTEGEGDAVVFLHGYGLESSTWAPQMAEFSKTHRAVSYDYRGFGRSDRPTTGYSFPNFITDLAGVLDTLEIRRATLCGLSFGVLVSLNAAILLPERVSGLLLADAAADAPSDATRLALGRRLAALLTRGYEPEKGLATAFSRQFIDSHPKHVEQYLARQRRNNIVGLVGGMVMLMQVESVRDRLSSISVPVSVISGEFDNGTPPDGPQRLAAAIPNATFTQIPGAGHLTNEENPTAFNACLRDLLNRVKTTT